jgi:hypothetical protein
MKRLQINSNSFRFARKLATFQLAFLLIVMLVVFLGSCTDNSQARSWGGTETIALPSKNEVLLNVTWKNDQLWVLSKDTATGTSHFREHSAWGLIEGEIIIK